MPSGLRRGSRGLRGQPDWRAIKVSIERIGAILGIVAVLASICVTFGIQMANPNSLKDDVSEVKQTVEKLRDQQMEIMKAIGEAEARRWRASH